MVGLGGLEPPASSLSGFCPRACFCRITPATCANDVPLETAGDRCEPLGSDGMWTKRGPSGAAQWSKAGLSVGRCGVAVLEAIGLGPRLCSRLWFGPPPTERIALDSGRGWRQPGAAAIPVEYEVLLDGHDGDLVSLIAGVLQDPVDHGLLVGPVGDPPRRSGG